MDYRSNPLRGLRMSQALHILGDALWKTNDDAKKNLFRSMMDILRFLDSSTSDRHYYFGVNDFAFIWEYDTSEGEAAAVALMDKEYFRVRNYSI